MSTVTGLRNLSLLSSLDCTTHSLMRGGISGHFGGCHRLVAGRTTIGSQGPSRMSIHPDLFVLGHLSMCSLGLKIRGTASYSRDTGHGLLQPSAMPPYTHSTCPCIHGCTIDTCTILPCMPAGSQPGSHMRMNDPACMYFMWPNGG